ncbi:MAG TPA: GIY-YIG nuclease family protein [bacterium]|nr:GIY-YIG nuclease family protein [bacterium]HPL95164.1 GIY-YIG nuclease family protein [bacterium]
MQKYSFKYKKHHNKFYSVYIMTNISLTLYTGITNNLKARVWQHKYKIIKGFTARYNIKKLVYYETYNNPADAIGREKEIKGWVRKKKLKLIKDFNPTFKDLFDEV